METSDDQIIDGVIQAFSKPCRLMKITGSNGLVWTCVRWIGHPGRCRSEIVQGSYIEWWPGELAPIGLKDYIWVTTRKYKHKLVRAAHYHGNLYAYFRGDHQ